MKPFLLCALLMGCTSQVRLDPVIQRAPPVAVPTTQPLTLNPVQWRVLAPADLKADKSGAPVFALDAENYQNLALNFIEIKRFMSEQKSIIGFLKKVVETQSSHEAASKNVPSAH